MNELTDHINIQQLYLQSAGCWTGKSGVFERQLEPFHRGGDATRRDTTQRGRRRRFIRRRSLDHHLHQLEFHQGHSGGSNNASYSLSRGFISSKLSNQRQRAWRALRAMPSAAWLEVIQRKEKKTEKYLISNTKIIIFLFFFFSVQTNWATRLQSDLSSRRIGGQQTRLRFLFINILKSSLNEPPSVGRNTEVTFNVDFCQHKGQSSIARWTSRPPPCF